MKQLHSLLAALLLLVVLALPVSAAEPQLGYVTDAAGLLTPDEQAELEQYAQDLSQTYRCGLYLVTVDDYTQYVRNADITEAAKTIYREYSLGLGEDRSGILLLLSMAERDYALISYGYGNTVFTDYGKDRLAENFLDNFRNDDWFGGFSDYLKTGETLLQAAKQEQAAETHRPPTLLPESILLSVVPGCLLALLVSLLVKRSMKSVAAETEADAYFNRNSLHFTKREDRFLYITETRVKIQSDSDSGGASIGSDGFSGKSGKF